MRKLRKFSFLSVYLLFKVLHTYKRQVPAQFTLIMLEPDFVSRRNHAVPVGVGVHHMRKALDELPDIVDDFVGLF